MMNKQIRLKKKILEQLEKIPIIEHACQRAGVPRSTYYRWIKDDINFRHKAIGAQDKGYLAINDIAESKLVQKVTDGEWKAVTYWLESNHKNYSRSQRNVVIQSPEHEPPSDEQIDQMIKAALDSL